MISAIYKILSRIKSKNGNSIRKIKNIKLIKSIKLLNASTQKLNFLIFKIRIITNLLWQIFIKILIL